MKNQKKNSKLFIIKNINDLNKVNILSKNQLTRLRNNYDFNLKQPVINITDLNTDVLVSIALLQPNIEFRKSTIDQAARITLKLKEKSWDAIFLSSFEDEDIYNFLLGWGLSFYDFQINISTITLIGKS